MSLTRFIKALSAVMLTGGIFHTVDAQYYDWGNSPVSIKWDKITTPDVKLIYPQTFELNARRMLHYFDTTRPYINFGYTHGTMKTPVVMHTRNMSGNGIVMWAPKRIELLSAPGSTYSEPWLKQLAIHEFRHNVQYNNLNRGTIKVLSWFLGEQIKLLGPWMFGVLFLEGDAVMAETEMSAFGRGLQPSYTMHYRAVGDVGSDRYSKDLWFCGSYRYHVPDHYQLGYQMVRWSYDHYDEFIFDKMAHYVARNPLFCFPMSIGLNKHYGTSERKIFHNSFADLNEFWASLPQEEDSAVKIETPIDSYTTYQWPLWLDDQTIAVFKKDLDRPSRIAIVDVKTGSEKIASYIGIVSSRPVFDGAKLWWTEYRYSALWGEKVDTQLCFFDIAEGKKGVARTNQQILFPVAQLGKGLAYVVYDYTGQFSIRKGLNALEATIEFPLGTEITALAWDDVTDRLYFIGLDDGGMWLGSVDQANQTYDRLTPSRHITISELRAHEGKLYFGSIVSGKDEAHYYDLATGIQYRLSTSKYGSFQPSPNASGSKIALTTYDKDGYKLSVQQTDSAIEQPQRELPVNLVNPDWKRWDLPKMDTIRFTGKELAVSEKKHRPKRYRKGLNLFNLHSWLPIAFYPPSAIEEMQLDVNLGATVMSQSLLSDMISWLSYGWNHRGGSILKGGLNYSGLGAHLDIGFTWGGGDQLLYTSVPSGTDIKRFFSVNSRLSLPMVIGSGYTFRSLTPAIEYYYTNGLLFDVTSPTTGDITRGVERISFALTYAQQSRMAHRDFLPRWGFAAKGSYVINPTNSDFLGLYSLYARGYLPGVAPHHSTTIRASWQQTVGEVKADSKMFHMKEVFPRGALYSFATKRWVSGSIDYQFPIWYPEAGIPGILYFKRVRVNLFGDYARWQAHSGQWNPIYSYGGDILLDLNPFNMPGTNVVTTKLTIAKPSDRRGVMVSFGISVPL